MIPIPTIRWLIRQVRNPSQSDQFEIQTLTYFNIGLTNTQISIGTTTFTGDGDRLFLNFKEVGILFSHEDAEDFLKAAMAAYLRLGYGSDGKA